VCEEKIDFIHHQYKIKGKNSIDKGMGLYPAKNLEIFMNQKKNETGSCDKIFQNQRKGGLLLHKE